MDKKVRSIEISKRVPIVGNYDVVVCGGGPAGFIAAIAAARSGAKTAVVEQYGFGHTRSRAQSHVCFRQTAWR